MAKRGGRARAAHALLDRLTWEADALKAPTVARLAPVVRGASAFIAQEIRLVLGAVDPSKPYTRAAHHRVLLRLRDRLAGAELAVSEAARFALGDALERAAKTAHRHASEWVASASRGLGPRSVALGVRESSVLLDARSALLDRQARAASRLAADISADVRLQLALGVKRGETAGKVLERLEKLGGPRSKGLDDSLATRYQHRAARLAATETNVAYNAGQASVTRRTGMKRRWDSRLDAKVCRICRALDGETREMGQEFTGGLSQPPAHPYCRCTLSVWMDEWSSI